MVLIHDSKMSKKKGIKKFQSRYLKNLLPYVFRSEGDMVEFNPSKILKSLIIETALNEREANYITELVVRRIISSGIKFLSGPHIREIVCSILSEQHFENERKIYTRIGMPLMDYEAILESKSHEKSFKIINPEEIHNWAAKRISNEYTLLRILNSEESKAHLCGDIHINKLSYFDLRPYKQIWDPRLIFENGIPPIREMKHCNKSGPATNLKTAISHLAKWVGIIQSEFSGTQCYDNITMFLAPYAVGLSNDEIERTLRLFIYEINQIIATRGNNFPNVILSTTPTILQSLIDVPAIGAHGEIIGKYGDFKDECFKLFNALINIYIKGDYNKKPFIFPKHEIKIKKHWMRDYESSYLKLIEETASMRSPNFYNMCPKWISDENVNFLNYMTIGSLQEIILNLARYAYMSKKKDDYFDIITEKMELCSNILLKKRDIIKKRIKTGHLPLCGGKIRGKRIFKLKEQKLNISFIGLNEMVKYLTNFELHENDSAYNLGKEIIQHIRNKCAAMSERDNVCYCLSELNDDLILQRLTRLDLRRFPKKAKSIINGTYTNSYYYHKNAKIPLYERIKKQGEFHPIIGGRVMSYLPLREKTWNHDTLWDITKKLCFNTNTAYFTFDFTDRKGISKS